MQRVSLTLAATLAGLSFASPSGAAALLNGGFESGLANWIVEAGTVDVVSATPDTLSNKYLPQEGASFARLTAGEPDGQDTILRQTFSVVSAFRLSGFAAFVGFDYLPYDDSAFVQLLGDGGRTVLFTASIGVVGDYTGGPWTAFSSDVLGAGTYTLIAGVNDAIEPGYSSQLLLDGLTVEQVAGVVPEPSAWAMMLVGFGVAGGLLRARRRGPAAV